MSYWIEDSTGWLYWQPTKIKHVCMSVDQNKNPQRRNEVEMKTNQTNIEAKLGANKERFQAL